MEEVTPSIYYMVSWLEEKFKNKEEEAWVPYEVEGAQPFFIPGYSITFYISFFFFFFSTINFQRT